jgi:hypothetical protein
MNPGVFGLLIQGFGSVNEESAFHTKLIAARSGSRAVLKDLIFSYTDLAMSLQLSYSMRQPELTSTV